jgi:hypothetical protein
MTELLRTDDTHVYANRQSGSVNLNLPIPADDAYESTVEIERFIDPASPPRIEDLDEAYKKREIKYARAILNYLMRHLPYSSDQNRITLNQLAHPLQQRIAIEQQGGVASQDLVKDIEAVYDHAAEQLKSLISQAETFQGTPEYADIIGSLSELNIFLLSARSLTGEDSDAYSLIPSTNAEDKARLTREGIRQGIDFKVIRRSDGVQIPLQVKTSAYPGKIYSSDILVVPVNDLVYDPGRRKPASSIDLSRAMLAEIEGRQDDDSELIDLAQQRLFSTFENYNPEYR